MVQHLHVLDSYLTHMDDHSDDGGWQYAIHIVVIDMLTTDTVIRLLQIPSRVLLIWHERTQAQFEPATRP